MQKKNQGLVDTRAMLRFLDEDLFGLCFRQLLEEWECGQPRRVLREAVCTKALKGLHISLSQVPDKETHADGMARWLRRQATPDAFAVKCAIEYTLERCDWSAENLPEQIGSAWEAICLCLVLYARRK